jgi:transposase
LSFHTFYLSHLFSLVNPVPFTCSHDFYWTLKIQEVTGDTVELAYTDQGYTGDETREATEKHGIRLEVVKLSKTRQGFILLPKRWVVERSFAWTARFRRLARDYERLPETLAGLPFLALVVILLKRFTILMAVPKVHNTL